MPDDTGGGNDTSSQSGSTSGEVRARVAGTGEIEPLDTVGQVDSDPSDVFAIPWRPERTPLDQYVVRDDDGTPVRDETGDVVTGGGGSVIEGYTQFSLTSDAYDRDEIDAVVTDAESWGAYVMSEWEAYDYFVFDTQQSSAFEVRVLPDRVAVDVKANTNQESIREFVTQLAAHSDTTWTVTRASERIRA